MTSGGSRALASQRASTTYHLYRVLCVFATCVLVSFQTQTQSQLLNSNGTEI